ncbi:hypothetical protein [Shewanella insulae]
MQCIFAVHSSETMSYAYRARWLDLLLLIAMLAEITLWLIGIVALHLG